MAPIGVHSAIPERLLGEAVFVIGLKLCHAAAAANGTLPAEDPTTVAVA